MNDYPKYIEPDFFDALVTMQFADLSIEWIGSENIYFTDEFNNKYYCKTQPTNELACKARFCFVN